MSQDEFDNSLDELKLIDSLSDHFEDAWLNNSRPDIRQYATKAPENSETWRRLLIELICIDIAHRWKCGDKAAGEDYLPCPAKVEDYLAIFPALGVANSAPVEIVVAECRARKQQGVPVSVAEIRKRFGAVGDELIGRLRHGGKDNKKSTANETSARGNAGDVETVELHPGQITQSATDSRSINRRYGDYEILHEIARGGMGVIYKARHVSLDRSVALKMIKSGDLASDEEIQRFQVEAQAAAKLDHPNIVSVYEVGEEHGQRFFAMNFVEGESLSTVLQNGPLPRQTAVEICQKVAIAIAYAHTNGVVHRDLKPGNILLDSGGEPRITDFGLARHLDGDSDLTVTGQIVGTPSFMAPEQAMGQKRVTQQADVYALGAILYVTLTGRPPFQAATVVDTLVQVREQEPLSPRLLDPTIDRDLETVCLKCLQKEPARRYDSAGSFAADLGRWIRREPIVARRVSTTERLIKWMRRRPAIAAATTASILAVFLLGIAIAALSYNNKLETSLDETKSARQQAESSLAKLVVAKKATDSALAEAEDANHRARQADYYRKISLAQVEWENGNVSSMLDLLEGCDDELRQWEWHFLHRLCHQDLLTIHVPREGVFEEVAYSPDGSLLATVFHAADGNSQLHLYDAATGKLVKSIDVLSSTSYITFEQSGTQLFTGHRHGLVDVFSVPALKEVTSFDFRRAFEDAESTVREQKYGRIHLALSPDSRRLAFVALYSEHACRFGVFNIRSGELILDISRENVRAIQMPVLCAMHPNGKTVAFAFHGGAAELYDALEGSHLRSLRPNERYALNPRAFGFKTSGAELAIGGSSKKIMVWNVESGSITHVSNHDYAPADIDYSLNDAHIVTCQGQEVRLLKADSGQKVCSFRGHRGKVRRAAISPNGQRIASVGDDGTLKIWKFQTSPSIDYRILRPAGDVSHVNYSPDGSRLAATRGKSGRVGVWDAQASSVLVELSPESVGNAATMALSPDGRKLATSNWRGPYLYLSDAQTGKLLHRKHVSDSQESVLSFVEFTPDSKYLVACTPTGKVLMMNCEDLSSEWEQVTNDHHMRQVAVHPNGRQVAYCGEHIAVLDLASGEYERQLKTKTWNASIRYRPDGKVFVSGGADGVIRIWNADTGDKVAELTGHLDRVWSIAFSPNGKRFATASGDSVRIWDAQTYEQCLMLRRSGAMYVTFDPKGHYVAAAGGGKIIRIWDARPLNVR